MMYQADSKMMQKALDQAKLALQKKEVPVGAVIVDKNNEIIAAAHNEVEQECSQTYHAEIIALQQAGKKINNWRLQDCTLYVTLEPCTMCCAALQLSKIARVVYAASSNQFGYKKDQDQFIGSADFSFILISGVLKEEALQLLKHFFSSKRPIK